MIGCGWLGHGHDGMVWGFDVVIESSRGKLGCSSSRCAFKVCLYLEMGARSSLA